MEIDKDVYMKFRHAYVVGEVKEEEITLLDPHGDVEGKDKRKVYSPDLADLVESFNKYLVILEEELKASGYSSFSIAIRDKIKSSIDLLRKNRDKLGEPTTRSILEDLRKNWARLSNKDKLIEEDGQLTGLRSKTAKNILGVLIDKKTELNKLDIGKGFTVLKENTKVRGKQEMNCSLLKTFFESIRINKIKR